MNADVQFALRKVNLAASRLAAVAQLPTEIGARVQWTGNGLIWERVGEDEWMPIIPDQLMSLEDARLGDWTAPSTHIAEEWVTAEIRDPRTEPGPK